MGLRSCMKNTWCWKFTNTKPGKIIKFIVLLILDLIDVAIDWYFYAKVKLIEPGLIYGPPENSFKWAVFAFCIVSTIALLIETIQNADDLFAKKKIPFLSQSLANFITIVFEDVPLLVLNLMLTLCRDGDVSVISLTKATLCIACVIVRFLLMILVYWIFDRKKTRLEYILDLISTIGLLVVAVLSVSIQLLNNFPIDNNGLIKITKPENFNRLHFLQDKYLNNVGIYMKWPPISSQNGIYENTELWLADINELFSNVEIQMQIRFNKNIIKDDKTDYKMCIMKSTANANLNDCYRISNKTYIVKISELDTQMSYGYNIRMIKRSSEEFKYLLGYIDYNIKTYQDNRCFNTNIDDNLLTYAKYLPKYDNTNKTIDNLYFKYNEGINYYTLFNLYYDLNVADKIWKTGIIGCNTNGDKKPKLNTNIEISC